MSMGYPTKKKPIYDGVTKFTPFENRYTVSYIGVNGRDTKYKKITFRECKKLEESFGKEWIYLDWNIRVYSDEMKNGRMKSGKFHIYLNEDKGYALEFPGYILEIGDIYKIGCHIKHYDEFEPFICTKEFFKNKIPPQTFSACKDPSPFTKYKILAKVSIEDMKVIGFRMVGEV